MANALRDELLAVPGIAGAEVETGEGVAGVRVQLALGADAAEVGTAVRQILIQHGMRPAEEIEEVAAGPPPPPGAPGSVVSFPLVGEHAKTEAASFDEDVPAPEEMIPAGEESEALAPDTGTPQSLGSVAVEETSAGLKVVVRLSGGEAAEVAVNSGLAGLDASVAEGVANLIGAAPVQLIDVQETTANDSTVLTVFLTTVDQGDVVGAAIQTGGRAFAVARAVWAALRSPV
jgi:hypothetical protein